MPKITVVALLLATVAITANAQVAGSLGGQQSDFITLSHANVTGGALYSANTNALPYAAIPANASGTWLAVGPDNYNNGGGDATLSLRSGISHLSFLWGSPDSYNRLTVYTTKGSSDFTASALGIVPVAGDQAQSDYVQFAPTMVGDSITKVVFSSPTTDAFEVANIAAVPEPGTYALLLAGLGAIGIATRRSLRQRS